MKSSLSVIFSFIVISAFAQTSDSVAVRDVLNGFERKSDVKFFYRYQWIENIKVTKSAATKPFESFLNEDLRQAGIKYIRSDRTNYIILFRGQIPTMEVRRLADSVSAVGAQSQRTQDIVTISGIVEDANNDEPVVGATIMADEERKGTTTDVRGHYSLSLPAGVHTLRITAIGKLPTTQRVNVQGDVTMNFKIFEEATQLDNITITSENLSKNISSGEMSQVKIDIKTLKTIPPFMGEVDVVKSLLLLPGVSSVGEGSSGFNVRGGNVDQNLILLDDAPLFNSSHLFGFFSTFNPDFVKDVVLYKGGMPASFGGRISSVLDVKLKDGNANKITASGGLGIISSRLLVEGPIGKKTTFIAGGRYAYPDWIMKKIPDQNVAKSSAWFYDFNVRVKHQFNDKNSLQLSAYRSQDDFKFAADTTYGWNTTNFALRYNAAISEKLVANVNAIYSVYENNVKGTQSTKEFVADFGIDTKGIKTDLTWFASEKHKVDFGGSIMTYVFNPGKLVPADDASLNPVTLNKDYSTEQGYYISDEWKVNSALLINAGVRFSHYTTYGNGNVVIYDPELPRHPSTIIDTLNFSRSQAVSNYSGIEPRLSVKVSVTETSSIKFSYNRNFQYLQLISNTAAVSPLDLWKTSNYYIKPQVGNQFALGYFQNFRDNKLEFSLETYYKVIENQIEYKDGANLFLNPLLESQLLPSHGLAYGVEAFARKSYGRLTGWLSYAYARSLRKTAGATPEETINKGKYYPSNFDKPHTFSVASTYQFTKRLSMAANFTYSTGRPITYPQSVYVIDGYSFAQFSERNQARIPNYHRLDLSFTIEESLKRAKKWKGSWTFSAYNLYARKNAYSVFFKPQYSGTQTQSYRLAVVGTVFPAVTYNFKF